MQADAHMGHCVCAPCTGMPMCRACITLRTTPCTKSRTATHTMLNHNGVNCHAQHTMLHHA
eukprot:2459640-Prymnesium_polylepis.3